MNKKFIASAILMHLAAEKANEKGDNNSVFKSYEDKEKRAYRKTKLKIREKAREIEAKKMIEREKAKRDKLKYEDIEKLEDKALEENREDFNLRHEQNMRRREIERGEEYQSKTPKELEEFNKNLNIHDEQEMIDLTRAQLKAGEKINDIRMFNKFMRTFFGPSGNKDIIMALIEKGALKNKFVKFWINVERAPVYYGDFNFPSNILDYRECRVIKYDENHPGGLLYNLDRDILKAFVKNEIDITSFFCSHNKCFNELLTSENHAKQEIAEFFIKDCPKKLRDDMIYSMLFEMDGQECMPGLKKLVELGLKIDQKLYKEYLKEYKNCIINENLHKRYCQQWEEITEYQKEIELKKSSPVKAEQQKKELVVEEQIDDDIEIE